MNKLVWGLLALIGAAVVVASLVTFRPFGLDGNGGGADRPNPAPSNGKQTYHIESDGVSREFIVYRPTNIPADQATPLVFMFHGSGQSGEQFYQDSGWKQKADTEGVTVVYPTALKFHIYSDEKVVQGKLKTNVATFQTKWNSYELPSLLDPKYPDQTLHDDVAFVRDMMAFVEDGYAIDATRVYATGFSNGGQFTSRLAVEMSDVIAAFAPVASGRIYDEVLAQVAASGTEVTPRSVIHVIGANDAKLMYGLGATEPLSASEDLAADGNPVKDDYIAGFLQLEGLKDVYTYEEERGTAHFTYSTSQAGANNEYQFYVVKGMPHVYPNGENQPFDITDYFWPFFEQYSL